MNAAFTTALRELAATADRVATEMGPELDRALEMVRAAVAVRGTLFFCGNGGSAADAQHMATEYVVRFMRNRRAYPAIALTTDTSLLTAAGNDIGFENVFSRQVEALAKPGDLLIIHSTSGNSPNVLEGIKAAKAQGMFTIGFTGYSGGKLKGLVDLALVVPVPDMEQIEDAHMILDHILTGLLRGRRYDIAH